MAEKTSTVEDHGLDLIQCEKLLGTGEEYDSDHVLKCFQTHVWVKRENEEFDQIQAVVNAKNALIQSFIVAEVRLHGKFKIGDTPFENTCIKCNGTGELYEFHKKSKMITCRTCKGNREVWVKCKTCKGTKKGVDCLDCRGNEKPGYQLDSCKKCQGTGKEVIHPIIPKIKSTTSCKRCKGMGWIEPKEPPPPENPVIPANIGEAIKEGKPLTKKTKQNHEDIKEEATESLIDSEGTDFESQE